MLTGARSVLPVIGFTKNSFIGSIGSEKEDSFHKPVAGFRFKASGNENKDIAQDCVSGYRFRSNGISKIDCTCTVEQIEAIITRSDLNKAKDPDGIVNILLKKVARTLSNLLLLLFKSRLNKEKLHEK